MSTCDCGLPIGSVTKGVATPGSCFARTRYAEHYEQDECYLRQIANLERGRDVLKEQLAVAEASIERIWESAYNSGWANRHRKQSDWSLPDEPNPYSRKETLKREDDDYDDG